MATTEEPAEEPVAISKSVPHLCMGDHVCPREYIKDVQCDECGHWANEHDNPNRCTGNDDCPCPRTPANVRQ